MWNLKKYKKICSYSKKIQNNNKKLSSFCNSYLHIIRAHPFILKKYNNIFFFKSFIFYISLFFKNIFEIVTKFFIQFLYKETLNTHRKKYKILVLGHITNFKAFSKNIDFQYGSFFKNKNNDILYFYINSSKTKRDKIKSFNKLKKTNKNYYIFNYKLGLFDFVKYFIYLFSEFLILILKNYRFYSFNKYYRRFIYNSALSLISQSTFQNLIFYHKFNLFVKKYSIQKIITTFEGHPFEKLIFKIGYENSIPVDAYQHSFISDTHHSIYVYPNQKYLPTRILTSGKITYDIFDKYFGKKLDVKLIGSTKAKSYKKNKKNYNSFRCLVVPEGFYEETEILINFCLEYLEKYQNIEFIVRLHPEVIKHKLLKRNSKYNFKSKKIKISHNKILHDVKKSNLLLYRGSTFAADALANGLKPFYLKRDNEIEIDSLWMFKDKFKEKINNIDQLNKKIASIKYKDLSFNQQRKTIIFSKSFYGKFNNKIKI